MLSFRLWLCLLICFVHTLPAGTIDAQLETSVLLEPPEDFSPEIEVAGCYCVHEGKLLFLLRNPQKPQGNTWCIPGGKLEDGETPQEAVIREVREETGIELSKKSLVHCRTVYVRFPERDLVLHLFKAYLKKAPQTLCIASDEHIACRWVTFNQALEMPLIPGGEDCLRLAAGGYVPPKKDRALR